MFYRQARDATVSNVKIFLLIKGAATAFGLVSLLPLNVPENKPLLYCNSTEIAQAQIRIEENIFSCLNQTIVISCAKSLEDETVVDDCSNITMECDMKDNVDNLFCTNATLVSRVSLVCNSTTIIEGTNINDSIAILDCYEGQIPSYSASFIPTTTEAPLKSVEKRLSMSAKVHIFFMKISGKSDIVEKVRTSSTTTAPEPIGSRFLLNENETLWVPEALTIPPETTSTTKTEEENFSFSDETNEEDEDEMDFSTHSMITENSTN